MTSTPRAPATATLLSKVKRAAKRQAKISGIQHAQALEAEARTAGYPTFHDLQQAVFRPMAAAVTELPVDPRLRKKFDQTPNEDRSKAEIDKWWDRPFAITNPRGGFDVYCLDGGAWDRATWYFATPDLAGAAERAQQKLAKWREFRSAPVASIREGGAGVDVVRMPQRPDGRYQILFSAKDSTEAAQWIAQSTQAARASPAVASSSESVNGAG